MVSSHKTDKNLLEYQISQERLPVVTGLNYELPLQLQRVTDSILNDTLDYSDIPEAVYPLQIPIYNIGIGIAQNCKAEWDEQSVQDACTKIVDSLAADSSVKITEYSFKQPMSKYWYLYDYIVYVEKDKIIQIIHLNESEYIMESLDVETVRLPFLQPITNDAQSLNISLPKGVSVLLLEMANQEIELPITMYLKVSYQDIVGKEFMHNYAVTFQPTIESKSDSNVNGYIYISFQESNLT